MRLYHCNNSAVWGKEKYRQDYLRAAVLFLHWETDDGDAGSDIGRLRVTTFLSIFLFFLSRTFEFGYIHNENKYFHYYLQLPLG